MTLFHIPLTPRVDRFKESYDYYWNYDPTLSYTSLERQGREEANTLKTCVCQSP